jgi:hypothetical protein
MFRKTRMSAALAVTTRGIEAQVGAPQGGFHSQISIGVSRDAPGKHFLCAGAGCICAGNVNLLHILSRIRKHSDNLRLDLCNAASNSKDFLAPLLADFDESELQGREDGRMSGKNAHFPGGSRQDDNIHVTREYGAILRNDFTTNGHRKTLVIGDWQYDSPISNC